MTQTDKYIDRVFDRENFCEAETNCTTVGEFIDCVLSGFPNERGFIEVYPMKGVNAFYKNGELEDDKLTKNNLPTDVLNLPLRKNTDEPFNVVYAHGNAKNGYVHYILLADDSALSSDGEYLYERITKAYFSDNFAGIESPSVSVIQTNCITIGELYDLINKRSENGSKDYGYIDIATYGIIPFNGYEPTKGDYLIDVSKIREAKITHIKAERWFSKIRYIITIENFNLEVDDNFEYRIRKLTPRECFRLMDVDDDVIDKIQNAKLPNGKPAISKSQQYKMAGNSIVVSCLYHIFHKMFVDTTTTPIQLSLFN